MCCKTKATEAIYSSWKFFFNSIKSSITQFSLHFREWHKLKQKELNAFKVFLNQIKSIESKTKLGFGSVFDINTFSLFLIHWASIYNFLQFLLLIHFHCNLIYSNNITPIGCWHGLKGN